MEEKTKEKTKTKSLQNPALLPYRLPTPDFNRIQYIYYQQLKLHVLKVIFTHKCSYNAEKDRTIYITVQNQKQPADIYAHNAALKMNDAHVCR